MSTLTLADAYIAGWRMCRLRPPTPIRDPNLLPQEHADAWAQGMYDAITRPQQQWPDPVEAGYD